MEVANDRWYAGREQDQVFVIQGMTETPLRHYVRHSPDGFSWGYGGSGPADLARSLLIDALGDEARCDMCEGTGVVVINDGEEVPVSRVTGGGVISHPFACNRCEDGVAVEPALYQAFKFDVIAKLPVGRPWSMPRQQILAWLSSHARTPDGIAP